MKFGGAEGIAEKLFEEYQRSKPGTPFRSKMLDLMVGMMCKNMEQEEVDFSQHSEEELLDLLTECVMEE